jgi:seryl-tRNA synthetase
LQKKQDATELIQSTEEIKGRLAAKETEVQEAKTTLDAKLVTIGNIVHESVPVSKDEVCCKCKPLQSVYR